MSLLMAVLPSPGDLLVKPHGEQLHVPALVHEEGASQERHLLIRGRQAEGADGPVG